MENHSFGDIIGNTSQAPYINSLAGSCGLATNYHNTTGQLLGLPKLGQAKSSATMTAVFHL